MVCFVTCVEVCFVKRVGVFVKCVAVCFVMHAVVRFVMCVTVSLHFL